MGKIFVKICGAALDLEKIVGFYRKKNAVYAVTDGGAEIQLEETADENGAKSALIHTLYVLDDEQMLYCPDSENLEDLWPKNNDF